MVAIVPRRKVVFSCPFCRSPLVKRTSHLAHRYLRYDVFVCENPVCAASFSAHTEITHLTSPTGIPDALDCELPATPHLLRSQAQAAYRAERQSAQMDLLEGTCAESSP